MCQLWSTCLGRDFVWSISLNLFCLWRMWVYVDGWGVCACVFAQVRIPGSHSALQDGVQATRWRSDSVVSPKQPFPADLSTCGLPEGHNILLSDHNTQTKLFYNVFFICFTSTGNTQYSSVPGEAYLNRIFFSVASCASFTVTFSFPLSASSTVLLPLNNFFPPHCTNTDKQAPGKHPE